MTRFSIPFLFVLASTSAALAQSVPGSLSGMVYDPRGSAVSSAILSLNLASESGSSLPPRAATPDASGRFRFEALPAGVYRLSVSAPGFTSFTKDNIDVTEGQDRLLDAITLEIAPMSSTVNVSQTQREIAEDEVRAAEKQRFLGILPNFYVVYDHNPVPLSPGQKMRLAFRSTIDPSSFVISGIIAGVQQKNNDFRAYGQGAAGYGRRFGAAYGDVVATQLIGQGLVPVLLRQDPRYYYKGTGSKGSRALYALASGFRTKGDNGKWQPNYSLVIGSVAASGLSNLYYPSKERLSGAEIISGASLALAAQGIGNLLQEFLFKKATRGVQNTPDPAVLSAPRVP